MKTTALAAILAMLALLPSGVAAKPDSSRNPIRTVALDPEGDWGSNQAPGAEPAGMAVGQDLVSGAIGPGEDDSLNFILHLSSLPHESSTASAVYEWYFSVDGQPFGFYGPCQGHIYGDCETATDPMAFVITDFGRRVDFMAVAEANENAATITFPVPRSFIGATSGSVVRPRSEGADEAIVAHTFYFVNSPTGDNTRSPRDFMKVSRNYRVP